ncbi:alpha/beta hydrolase [Lacticaseibacillus camelliae]|uniref:alpha/beta hydrolase n=1 Tax=Lacticaseibacillus camelliae TaxID=381742 RepID=UPI000AA15A02|nr:alpha/beta hydrolase [Lacticaseibacillus camelliae]
MAHIKNNQIHPDVRKLGVVVRKLVPEMSAKFFRRGNWFMRHFAQRHFPKDMNVTEHWAQRPDGSRLRIIVAQPMQPKPLATGVLWLHGGGYAMEIPEIDLSYARHVQAVSNAVVVMPDYRLSTEAPYPAALDDAYLALRWMNDHHAALGINPEQLFVAGESAGGGLTAALTLYARDQGEIPIAFQMPLYPMLDDRPTASSAENDAPIWNTKSNANAWRLYLGAAYRTDHVSPYAAPARATDYRNLPPTYTFVGTIEPFYQETLTYIKHLQDAGVAAHCDVYDGWFHGVDIVAPKTAIAKKATAAWQAAFKAATEKYYWRHDG